MNPQSTTKIKLASSVAEIQQCYPIMSQLRLHLKADKFVQQIQSQMASGYQLAYIQDPEVIGVAGFKIDLSLSWGKYLYVADLVVDTKMRSHGYGSALFTWLVTYAKQHNCQQFHLDSGVQRFAAHRFYLRQKLDITSHHFTLKL